MDAEREDYAEHGPPATEDRLASAVALVGLLFAPGLAIVAVLLLAGFHYR